jgi:arylsulfatase A-like enzyme
MPSRGALLTGRHPLRTGLNRQISSVDERKLVALPHDEVILPRFLQPAGYASGCFGKWNIGFAPGGRPTDRGFDEYLGNISGNCDYYTHIYGGRPDLYRNTEPVELSGYSTFILADRACEFIRRHRDRPFLCYVPFNAAHFPNPRNRQPGRPALWQAPAEYFKVYGYSPETLDERERYHAVLTALDAGVGRVLDEIDRQGLRERTVVVLLSDNGAFMIPGRGLECASNRPLKGGGVTVWEGGIRVPCIVRWPGRIRPDTICREPLWSLDLLPMALRAAGLELPGDRILDGRDPTATLAGEAPSPHERLCWRWGSRGTAIRQGRYKLLRESQARTRDWQLFDLETDIGETKNLSAERPELARKLQAAFERWECDTTAGVKKAGEGRAGEASTPTGGRP